MRTAFLPSVQWVGHQDEFGVAHVVDEFFGRDRGGFVHHQEKVGLFMLFQQYTIGTVVVHQDVLGLIIGVEVVEGGIAGEFLGAGVGDVVLASLQVDTEGSVERPAQAIVVHMAADADEHDLGVGFHIELVLGHRAQRR